MKRTELAVGREVAGWVGVIALEALHRETGRAEQLGGRPGGYVVGRARAFTGEGGWGGRREKESRR